jgi:hypothetical protein
MFKTFVADSVLHNFLANNCNAILGYPASIPTMPLMNPMLSKLQHIGNTLLVIKWYLQLIRNYTHIYQQTGQWFHIHSFISSSDSRIMWYLTSGFSTPTSDFHAFPFINLMGMVQITRNQPKLRYTTLHNINHVCSFITVMTTPLMCQRQLAISSEPLLY